MKNFKRNKSAQTSPSLFDEVIKTYRKEDGSLNKLAIFISVLALILVLILGNALIDTVKQHLGLGTVSASELTLEQINDEVTNSFISALDEYVDGDYTQDELKEKLLKLLGDYLNASGGFTDEQLIELNLAIGDYLNETTIYEDIDKNEKAIEDIRKLIDEKYNSNREFVISTRDQLQALLDENGNLDQTRYDEIKRLIASLDEWLQGNTKSSINDLRDEITGMLNNLEENTNVTFANYFGLTGWDPSVAYTSSDYVSYNQKFYHSLTDNNLGNDPTTVSSAWQEVDVITLVNMLQKEIDDLNAHISDVNNSEYKFQYGYDENGCAGYYVDGQFKPF